MTSRSGELGAVCLRGDDAADARSCIWLRSLWHCSHFLALTTLMTSLRRQIERLPETPPLA